MTARDEHECAVELGNVFQEQCDIHGAGFRHFVVAVPCAEILMPLPDIAVERSLRVYLELMHIDVPAKQLLYRVHQSRMSAQAMIDVIIILCCKGGTRGHPVFLAKYFLAVHRENPAGLAIEERNFVCVKNVFEEQPAFFVELLELCIIQCQHHGLDLQVSGQYFPSDEAWQDGSFTPLFPTRASSSVQRQPLHLHPWKIPMHRRRAAGPRQGGSGLA